MPYYEFPSCSYEEILRMEHCQYEKDCVILAVQRKLFDFIHNEGGLSRSELIKKCGFSTRGGSAVISILCATKYLKIINQKYYLTSLTSNFLVSSSPYFYGPMLTLVYVPSPDIQKAFALNTEKHETIVVTDDWAEGKVDPEFANRIAAAMHSISLLPAVCIAKNTNLGKLFNTKAILDVGGGSGCFSIAISLHQPGIKTIVLDLPHQCKAAEKFINDAKNLPPNSVLTYGCNWFKEPFPKHDDPKYGYDTLLMSNILHDWDVETRKLLSKKAYDALPSNGTLLINEALFNDDETGSLHSAFLSFHMFLHATGEQLTFAELKDLLTSTGFTDVTILNTTNDSFTLISAKKSSDEELLF